MTSWKDWNWIGQAEGSVAFWRLIFFFFIEIHTLFLEKKSMDHRVGTFVPGSSLVHVQAGENLERKSNSGFD
jgi:hypothetical protein